MSHVELRPFTADDIPAAAQLLAQRHQRHRQAEPLLSPRFEDAAVTQAEIESAWSGEGASGSIAFRDGQPVGYLLGAPKADSWGPNIWVEAAGQAVVEAEVMRDLYGHAAARWIDEGRTAHYALAPAHDEALVDAWFRLGFGLQHMHAVRENNAPDIAPEAKVTIRDARRDDIPALAALEVVLPVHQSRSPVFSSMELPTLAEAQAEWEDDFDDPTYKVLVAEHDGHVVGSAIGCSLEKSSSHKGVAVPDNAGFLGFAAVLPEYRGLGAGRALGDAVMAWTATAGFDCIVTDWRVTNLLSSRAWPALGYRNTFARLHRNVAY